MPGLHNAVGLHVKAAGGVKGAGRADGDCTAVRARIRIKPVTLPEQRPRVGQKAYVRLIAANPLAGSPNPVLTGSVHRLMIEMAVMP
jgi:hypothetical protein